MARLRDHRHHQWLPVIQSEVAPSLLFIVSTSAAKIVDRQETEVAAERSQIRLKRVEEGADDASFKVGDSVEQYGLPNHPQLKSNDIQGWRRAKIVNIKGILNAC